MNPTGNNTDNRITKITLLFIIVGESDSHNGTKSTIWLISVLVMSYIKDSILLFSVDLY